VKRNPSTSFLQDTSFLCHQFDHGDYSTAEATAQSSLCFCHMVSMIRLSLGRAPKLIELYPKLVKRATYKRSMLALHPWMLSWNGLRLRWTYLFDSYDQSWNTHDPASVTFLDISDNAVEWDGTPLSNVYIIAIIAS
jgi:hypothetical protein